MVVNFLSSRRAGRVAWRRPIRALRRCLVITRRPADVGKIGQPSPPATRGQHGTRCAQGLGIGRATLYRYFEDETAVSDEIWLRLERLEQPNSPSFDDRTLVAMFASALVKVQAQIDEKGFLTLW